MAGRLGPRSAGFQAATRFAHILVALPPVLAAATIPLRDVEDSRDRLRPRDRSDRGSCKHSAASSPLAPARPCCWRGVKAQPTALGQTTPAHTGTRIRPGGIPTET